MIAEILKYLKKYNTFHRSKYGNKYSLRVSHTIFGGLVSK